jgi:hypothetical protein
LVEELMREHERGAVLAALGKNRRKGTVAVRDKVLELVDRDAEVGTLRFRQFRSTQRSELPAAAG